ncbi:MAG: SsrA-binding protein SmpB [Elusimicrobia bacterium]|nr:SsrA-binding protein SmpB [Elusimicrobiota bacterium]MBK7207949.1 SsrA-binding protein SmpB [Elusimicrobiota bacterium]MBK7544715.1 SsrA-binding protein SmpB [Elusimicrobiota bacterium]MBK7574247.1 SsrA-binding protein SmpB [Elusimicrobiota bacterium]MBK7688813.1 SsrA-binding protein SmpB [Elusimicrobiota bacterium]
MTTVARNRRAHHKYAILETFDGGLALTGPEVKSVRAGELHLEDGFGRVENGEIFLWNVHINPYRAGSLHVTQEPTRKRKILLHKTEIGRILGKLTTKGLTLVPLEVYFSKTGFAKVKLGLAKGKNAPDQREDLKRKDLSREMRRQFSGKHRV